MTDAAGPPTAVSRRTGAIRIAIGFVQGIALWLLIDAARHKVWPATEPGVLGALAMIVMFTPLIVLGGLANLRPRTLAVWTVFAGAVLAGLGLHDLVRRGAGVEGEPWVSWELMAYGAAGLFIAHHLVEGADGERKLIARYVRYFDVAWKHGVQLVLSAGFVGVFWIVLYLGAALFNLIGVKFLQNLLDETWFNIPATATMFAAAVHLTDVRSGLIRGIRTVALTLLSWLLPVLTVLATAFLLTLPFTGLDPLWKTRSAAGILLSAAATLIILINAAYQDGEPDGVVPIVLRVAGRLAGVLLIPLVAIAAYALWLRIGQHGLTPDRIVAAACALVGTVYAVGYAWSAARLGRWMRRLEVTNVVAAFVILAVLLALFTPLADPARLSVNDQMARLESGEVKPDKFDYRFLRFDGQRYGREALKTLKARGGDVGRRAGEALVLGEGGRWEVRRPDVAGLGPNIDVWPKGRTLPDSFLKTAWGGVTGELPDCGADRDRCDAFMLDLDSDGREEVLVREYGRLAVFSQGADGKWTLVGGYGVARCGDHKDAAQAIREGRVKTLDPVWQDLEIAGRRMTLNPSVEDCSLTPSKGGDSTPGF